MSLVNTVPLTDLSRLADWERRLRQLLEELPELRELARRLAAQDYAGAGYVADLAHIAADTTFFGSLAQLARGLEDAVEGRGRWGCYLARVYSDREPHEAARAVLEDFDDIRLARALLDHLARNQAPVD